LKRRKECEDAVESPQLRADGNLNLSTAFNFDRLHATRLVEARQALLREILPASVQEHGLRTALDPGCGVGYFSALLRDMGFDVSAFDARLQNVEEARRRHPGITFSIANIEDPAPQKLGQFDLVLCFGLLYHLENPMRAFRNLRALTGKLLLVESAAIPEQKPALYLRDDPEIEDQGVHCFAAYPTEGALHKMAYRSGFSYVARFASLPDHGDPRPTVGCRRFRTMLAASMTPLGAPHFVPVEEPQNPPDPWITDPTGVTKMWRRFGKFMEKPWQEKLAAMWRHYGPG
jgi:SAM-dependent methyltransferase